MQHQRRLLARGTMERRRLLLALERQQDGLRHAFVKCVRRLDDLPEGEQWEERAALLLRAGNLGRVLDPQQLVPVHLTETRMEFLRRRWGTWPKEPLPLREEPLNFRGLFVRGPRPSAAGQATYFERMRRLMGRDHIHLPPGNFRPQN